MNPFSGFDPVNANLIKDEILQLRDEGATILFSTHRMESVEELCDYMALIHKGNKLLDGQVNAIKRQYKSNTFEVGLEARDPWILGKIWNRNSNISETDFKSINDDLKLADPDRENLLLQMICWLPYLAGHR